MLSFSVGRDPSSELSDLSRLNTGDNFFSDVGADFRESPFGIDPFKSRPDVVDDDDVEDDDVFEVDDVTDNDVFEVEDGGNAVDDDADNDVDDDVEDAPPFMASQ